MNLSHASHGQPTRHPSESNILNIETINDELRSLIFGTSPSMLTQSPAVSSKNFFDVPSSPYQSQCSSPTSPYSHYTSMTRNGFVPVSPKSHILPVAHKSSSSTDSPKSPTFYPPETKARKPSNLSLLNMKSTKSQSPNFSSPSTPYSEPYRLWFFSKKSPSSTSPVCRKTLAAVVEDGHILTNIPVKVPSPQGPPQNTKVPLLDNIIESSLRKSLEKLKQKETKLKNPQEQQKDMRERVCEKRAEASVESKVLDKLEKLKITNTEESNNAEKQDSLPKTPMSELRDGSSLYDKNILKELPLLSIPPIGTPKIESKTSALEKQIVTTPFKHGEIYTFMDIRLKGFLIATHLVKTAPADQAGIEIGDIFVKFGELSKDSFKGLIPLADYVQNNVNQKIPVIVLRSEVELSKEKIDLDTEYKCLHLLVEPHPSKDIEGRGVIGAVINVWPMPKPVAD